MEKDKESLWLANNLMICDYEDAMEAMSEYGDVIPIVNSEDDKEWFDDFKNGNEGTEGTVYFDIPIKEIGETMHVSIEFEDGIVTYADVWYDNEED